MVEGGILSSIAIILALLSTYLPVIGSLITLIWPVPIILLGVRHGFKWSVMATCAAGVIIAMLLTPIQALAVVVGFGLIGVVIGYAFRKNYSPVKIFLVGTAASFVSKAAVLALGALITGINPIELQSQTIVQSFKEVIEIYRQMGINEEELNKLSNELLPMADFIKVIFPAALTIAAFIDTYLNFTIARIVLNKLGHSLPPFPSVKRWRFPLEVGYVLVAGLIMSYWGKSREIPLLNDIGANIQMISSIFLIIQGVALSYFLADKYNLSRFMFGLILILLFISGLFMQVLLFAGMFDLVFDFRRLKQR